MSATGKDSKHEIMPRMAAYLARAGYRGGVSTAPPEIMATARELYLLGLELSRPFVATACLGEGEVGREMLPAKLSGCVDCSFIVVSLGGEIDGRIDRFFAANEPLKGALLDAWGSEAVEALAGNVDERLRGERPDAVGTIRFAPGYGGFDVRMNAAWIDLVKWSLETSFEVEADRATGIITPRKSIVCAIGWTK